MRRSERGNAMFFILIATALFAALGFAVSQSNRGSSNALSSERNSLAASEIIEYGTLLSNAASQLKLRGFGDTGLSFKNNIETSYTDGNCTEDACRIFAVDGGGVIYTAPTADWLDSVQSAQPGYGRWNITGNNAVKQVGNDATPDLVAFLPYIERDICIEINDKLGLTNPADAPPQLGAVIDSYNNLYDGTYTASETLELPAIDQGKRAGCFAGNTTPPDNTYHFFQVLIGR